MAWIPEDQRTPAWEIWNVKFHCRLPYNQARSIDDIKKYGYVDSGDAELNRQRVNQSFETMMSIAQMIEYFKQGADLRVKRPSDTKRIHDIISNHLEGWKTFLDFNINMKGPPIEDLLMLDQFAAIVYEHAKRHLNKDWVDSIAARQMTDAAGFDVNDFLRQEVVVDERGEEAGPMYPDRQSYENTFSRQRRAAMRWR